MALVYNRTKAERTLLKTHEAHPPSLTVDLYAEFWRLNSGPNCLYSTPIATLLESIRARRVPVDFIFIFHSLRIPFYDGCLVVEIHDHRDQPPGNSTNERVVLWPDDETLYAEITLAASKDPGKWTDMDALTYEANHLLKKEPELILDPDPLISRVTNATLAVTTPLPYSFKRKRDTMAIDTAQEEEEKVQRAKTMNLMNPRAEKTFAPDFRTVNLILKRREVDAAKKLEQRPQTTAEPAKPNVNAQQVPLGGAGNASNANVVTRSRSNTNQIQQPPQQAPASAAPASLSGGAIANNLRRRNGTLSQPAPPPTVTVKTEPVERKPNLSAGNGQANPQSSAAQSGSAMLPPNEAAGRAMTNSSPALPHSTPQMRQQPPPPSNMRPPGQMPNAAMAMAQNPSNMRPNPQQQSSSQQQQGVPMPPPQSATPMQAAQNVQQQPQFPGAPGQMGQQARAPTPAQQHQMQQLQLAAARAANNQTPSASSQASPAHHPQAVHSSPFQNHQAPNPQNPNSVAPPQPPQSNMSPAQQQQLQTQNATLLQALAARGFGGTNITLPNGQQLPPHIVQALQRQQQLRVLQAQVQQQAQARAQNGGNAAEGQGGQQVPPMNAAAFQALVQAGRAAAAGAGGGPTAPGLNAAAIAQAQAQAQQARAGAMQQQANLNANLAGNPNAALAMQAFRHQQQQQALQQQHQQQQQQQMNPAQMALMQQHLHQMQQQKQQQQQAQMQQQQQAQSHSSPPPPQQPTMPQSTPQLQGLQLPAGVTSLSQLSADDLRLLYHRLLRNQDMPPEQRDAQMKAVHQALLPHISIQSGGSTNPAVAQQLNSHASSLSGPPANVPQSQTPALASRPPNPPTNLNPNPQPPQGAAAGQPNGPNLQQLQMMLSRANGNAAQQNVILNQIRTSFPTYNIGAALNALRVIHEQRAQQQAAAQQQQAHLQNQQQQQQPNAQTQAMLQQQQQAVQAQQQAQQQQQAPGTPNANGQFSLASIGPGFTPRWRARGGPPGVGQPPPGQQPPPANGMNGMGRGRS